MGSIPPRDDSIGAVLPLKPRATRSSPVAMSFEHLTYDQGNRRILNLVQF